jgi:hypothetical protein
MSNLKALRGEIAATQEDIIREGRLTGTTYRNAERGNKVRYSTATAILRTFNRLRVSKGMSELTLEDLDLSLE